MIKVRQFASLLPQGLCPRGQRKSWSSKRYLVFFFNQNSSLHSFLPTDCVKHVQTVRLCYMKNGQKTGKAAHFPPHAAYWFHLRVFFVIAGLLCRERMCWKTLFRWPVDIFRGLSPKTKRRPPTSEAAQLKIWASSWPMLLCSHRFQRISIMHIKCGI